jgi:hypothetical protein
MSIRSRDGLPGKPACGTQVAEAMMTCPVLRSRAIIDQVANAAEWDANTNIRASRTRFI